MVVLLNTLPMYSQGTGKTNRRPIGFLPGQKGSGFTKQGEKISVLYVALCRYYRSGSSGCFVYSIHL